MNVAFPPNAPPLYDRPPRDRSRRAMAAIILGVMLATLDTAIANTALPTLAATFATTAAASIWIVTAYQITMVALLLPMSALGVAIGLRLVSLIGLGLFTLASVLCALAPTFPVLIAARVLQAVGAAAVLSVNGALIRFIVPPEHLGRGLGYNAMAVAVGMVIGPTAASLILSVSSWPWLFAINLPLGAVAFALALSSLPIVAPGKDRFDALSAVMSAFTFGLSIFALGEAAQGMALIPVLFELAIALAMGAWLLVRQSHRPNPLFPVDLFRNRIFSLSTLTASCAFAAQGIAFVALPFLFQIGQGRTAAATGWLLMPWPLATALTSLVAGRLSDRYRPALLGGAGLLVLGFGLVCLGVMPTRPHSADIAWRMAVCGAGFGFFQSPNLRILLSAAPAHRSASANGVIGTARLFGQSIGAVLVALSFNLAGPHAVAVALAVASAFAVFGSAASAARLFNR